MFGKPEYDGCSFYLCEWTRNTVSYRVMKQEKLVRYCEDLRLQARER